jgi:hypothetical protein
MQSRMCWVGEEDRNIEARRACSKVQVGMCESSMQIACVMIAAESL